MGSATHVTVPAAVVAQPILPGPVAADIGVRTFAEINSTLSVLTGVPTTDTAVAATYQSVQQQLPATSTLESFSAANQVGVAQLAIQYCNEAVNSPSYSAALFPGVTFNASTFTGAGTSAITSALAAKVLGNGQLASSPAASTVTNELGNLITALCSTSACNNMARVQAVTAAACAAAFGSADMLIK